MPSRAVVARARKIRLLVMDVDGVLTDGRMILSERGDELKTFHTHDGVAVALAKRAGLRTAMVTGESSPIAKARGAKLGVDSVVLGARRKREAVAASRPVASAARVRSGSGGRCCSKGFGVLIALLLCALRLQGAVERRYRR